MIRRSVVLASIATFVLLSGCEDAPPPSTTAESDAGFTSNPGVDTRNSIIRNTTNTPPSAVNMTPPTEADADAVAQLSHIRYGMNIGNYLDQPGQPADRTQTQCDGFPQTEGAGAGGGKLAGWMFEAIKQAGFDHVRLTINWNCNTGHDAGANPNDIDKALFARIDWAIAHTLSRGMAMVIDIHNYWDYFNKLPGERDKLVSIWTQIAEHYKDYPKELYFELLNEPPYGFDEAMLGADYAACIQAIRATNPYRTIIYGGTDYNKAYTLPRLQTYLPDDKNLIATIHYYSPYCFTHGQTWDCARTYGDAYVATDNNVAWPIPYATTSADAGAAIAEKMLGLIETDFDSAATVATQIGHPIYAGEFGAMDKRDIVSRGAYTRAVVQAAEKRGMGWADWGFINVTFDAWKGTTGWYPEIINALRPDYTPTN